MMGDQFPKRCGCGRSHREADWARLAFCGYFDVPADELGPAERLELRHCACESTLAIQVQP